MCKTPASSNLPVSAALVLSPSYLVSACSGCLQNAAANDPELSSHECSLIRDLILDLQDSRVNHRSTRKKTRGADPARRQLLPWPKMNPSKAM
jgi:hypothetical protein